MSCRNPSRPVFKPLSLPVEVKDIIIDRLSDDAQSLRNCALSSRSLAPRSQFHLFRALRIKTRAQLNALYDHLDAYPRRCSLVHSVTIAPESPEELQYLLGIFPPALLSSLPNMRTWAIQGADGDASDASTPRALSFHKATLIQLRYTRIEELHLSHILFASDAELVRLVGSMRHLRHLQYTHVRVQKHGYLLSQSALARMAPHSLSTLDIHVQSTEDETADVILELAQHTLRNLTVRVHSQARWGSNRSTTRSSVQLKLESLTFHVEHGEEPPLDSLPHSLLEMCQYAASRISTFHETSAVKELAIHVSSSASIPSASLALRLIKSELFLQRFRSFHLDIDGQVPLKVQLHIHLPPCGGTRGVLVRGTVLASDNFVFEESYHQQVQYYSEGSIWRNATEGEPDSVIALAISPDGKWIASGSQQHAILRNAAVTAEGGSPDIVFEWIAPMDDDPFTRPFAFSPDSRVLACCTRDPEGFVQVRDVLTGNCLAVLRAPADTTDSLDACRASCLWSPNGETLTSVVFIPSRQQFLVQVWNAGNYRLISTTIWKTCFHSPSFLFSPNGHWLASFETAQRHIQPPPPITSMQDVEACTVLGAPLTGIPTACHILTATFDQASTRFAAVSSDHTLHVWNLSPSSKLLQVPLNEYPNDPDRLVLAFSPDGTQLLSCSGGRGAAFVLTLRDAASGRTLLPRRPAYHFLRGRTKPRFAFSDDGTRLLSASGDGFVQLWRAGDASFVGDVGRDGDAPTVFAWSADGRVLAWGTERGGVVVRPL